MLALITLGAVACFFQYAMACAGEHNTLHMDRLKKDEEPRLDLTGARAFWQGQLDEVGNYHIKGMPKDAVLIAQLHALTEDNFLVLHDENDEELARVLLWDVDSYTEFTPPEEEDSN